MTAMNKPVRAALLAALTLSSFQARAAERPNVLWIISDDLNMDVGAYGDARARTPNIDALAAAGVRFDRAYAQYPLCNPSRTSFLSGKRPDGTRVWDNATNPRESLGQDYAFLPEYFGNHGYFTGAAGKIAHFAAALKWDSYSASMAGAARKEPFSPPEMIHSMSWQATESHDSETVDGITARKIAALMGVKRDKPFFLAAGFHLPHVPCVAPKKYFDLHPLDSMELRPRKANDLADIPKSAFFLRESLLTNVQWKQVLQARAASVSFMDAQVGLLMRALDSLGLRRNTVVVFQSDHGFLLGEHQGGCYKSALFEPVARVPLIVSAPGKAKGASQGLVELVDIYPTLAELCGLPEPPGMEGISFAPLLAAPARPWKTAAFTQVRRDPNEGRFTASEITVPFMAYGMRTAEHRFTDWKAFGLELYDETIDRNEFTNLAFQDGAKQLTDSLALDLSAGWKAALPAGPIALKPTPGAPARSGTPPGSFIGRGKRLWKLSGSLPADAAGKSVQSP